MFCVIDKTEKKYRKFSRALLGRFCQKVDTHTYVCGTHGQKAAIIGECAKMLVLGVPIVINFAPKKEELGGCFGLSD